MAGKYFTIDKGGTGEFKEKGSKFLGFAFQVTSELEVKKEIEALRKEYYDARHHCYAYVLGMENQVTRANDDEEPNHSAGDPILGQIHSFELTDSLVVVVRYFGGTKLGVGGLVTAYKTAASEAIQNCRIREIFPMMKLELRFPYSSLGYVERQLTSLEAEVRERDFKENCMIQFSLKKALFTDLSNVLIDHPQIILVHHEE